MTAATIIDGIAPPAAAQPLFASDGGMGAFSWVQRGLTYMLAGRLGEARECFAAATTSPPPAALTMLLRDAYAKSAVLHSLFGSLKDARRDLDIAASLPMTTSWAEPVVAAHMEIAEATLVHDDDVSAAITRLERIPTFLVGELWSFWLDAIFRLYIRVGRPVEGVARIQLLSEGTAARSAREGYPGSILALLRGLGALIGGDFAGLRDAVGSMDRGLAITRLLLAAAGIQAGNAEPSVASLVGMRPELETLDQLEGVRVVVLAWAMLRIGDESTAQEFLESFVARRRGASLRLPIAPAEVDVFAQDRIPEWVSPVLLLPPYHLPSVDVLSPRELEVLMLLASDRTREQIAEELYVSVNTIKSQLSSIFRKLGVDNRLDAVLEAERRRLI